MFKIVFTNAAAKDYQKVLRSTFKKQVYTILNTLESNPYEPPYEKLSGNLLGSYSRRINIQHRIVYRIDEDEKTVVILRMWTHYGE